MRCSLKSVLRVCPLSLAIFAAVATPVHAAGGIRALRPVQGKAYVSQTADSGITAADAQSANRQIAYMAPRNSTGDTLEPLANVHTEAAVAASTYTIDDQPEASRPMLLKTRDTRGYRPFAFLGSMIRSQNSCRNSMGVGANTNMGVFLEFRKRC